MVILCKDWDCMLQKEANSFTSQHFFEGLTLSILFLDEEFMKLCSSQKYLGRHMLMTERILYTSLQKLAALFSFTHLFVFKSIYLDI